MKVRAALRLIVFVLVFTSFNEVRQAGTQAGDSSSGVVESAGAVNAQNPSSLAPSQENHTPIAPFHFEPLLLLLLGSALFSVGTAIKLVLARKLNPKSLGAATRKPTSPQY